MSSTISIQPIGAAPPRWLPGRCEKSGKRMFARKRDAEAQASAWSYHNSFQANAYFCEGAANGGGGCGHWHLARYRP
jgi:hypothetical protein